MEGQENILDTNKFKSRVETPEVLPVEVQEDKERIMSDYDIDVLIRKAQKDADDQDKLNKTRKELGIDPYSTNEEVKGNFIGDWTTLLQDRMKDQTTRNKFIASKIGILTSSAPYDRQNSLEKEETTKKYHYDQIRDYDNKIAKAFSFTTYVKSGEMAHSTDSLGSSKENGTVFIDATINGRPLSDEEKNAIEAHEKGHVLREFKINSEDFSKGFDFSVIPEDIKRPMYFRKPDELAERMSQLKNYFGFKGGELFTRQHLAYALSLIHI